MGGVCAFLRRWKAGVRQDLPLLICCGSSYRMKISVSIFESIQSNEMYLYFCGFPHPEVGYFWMAVTVYDRQKQCKNFSLLSSKLQFNWLLANSDNLVIIQLANFIYDCFEIHGK